MCYIINDFLIGGLAECDHFCIVTKVKTILGVSNITRNFSELTDDNIKEYQDKLILK